LSQPTERLLNKVQVMESIADGGVIDGWWAFFQCSPVFGIRPGLMSA
jgi:hypothetical protein